jgi:hypothetical protein
MYSPNGILADIEKADKASRLVAFKDAIQSMQTFGQRYAWLGYIVNMAHLLIFLLPHQDIGRYPIMIDSRDSESIYTQSHDKLTILLNKSIQARDKIKQAIFYQPLQA